MFFFLLFLERKVKKCFLRFRHQNGPLGNTVFSSPSLSLSPLSLSHTHTHTSSIFSLSLSLSLSHTISLSFTHTHTHTHTNIFSSWSLFSNVDHQRFCLLRGFEQLPYKQANEERNEASLNYRHCHMLLNVITVKIIIKLQTLIYVAYSNHG